MNELLDISIRLVVALLLGGLIGIEREFRAKDAGFRTHFLVSVGSALFCVVSQYGFGEEMKDASRVAAQVVSGIGFLGAGMIILQKNVIRGLTTAAGLWVTAAIGLACGSGMLMVALIATTLVLLGLEVLHCVIPNMGSSTMSLTFTAPTKASVMEVIEKIKKDSIELSSYELKSRHTQDGEIYEAKIDMKARKAHNHSKLMEYINEFDNVNLSCIE